MAHALSHCLGCGALLSRGRVVARRQVIDLPVTAVAVVEHVVRERRCPHWGARCRGAMPDPSGHVGAQRRLSWRVAALVAVLRTKLRLPLAQLPWRLAQVWGLRLSVGARCGLLAEAARTERPAYDALLADVRARPVIHLDETSWREDGRTGWIWTLTTPTARLFRFSTSRAGAGTRAVLGPDADGVIVSDCYTAYDQLDGRHQRCWAHLPRDIHERTEQHPDDAGLHAWAQAMRESSPAAVAGTAAAGACPAAERERARVRFVVEALTVCRAEAVGAPQTALCQRVEPYHPELFTFVVDLSVPPTNNAAERALRPLVIGRKISGGSRSAQGSRTRMILQSISATWEVRDLDPLAELLALLRAPHPPLCEMPPV